MTFQSWDETSCENINNFYVSKQDGKVYNFKKILFLWHDLELLLDIHKTWEKLKNMASVFSRSSNIHKVFPNIRSIFLLKNIFLISYLRANWFKKLISLWSREGVANSFRLTDHLITKLVYAGQYKDHMNLFTLIERKWTFRTPFPQKKHF